jgi:hypothetical protein
MNCHFEEQSEEKSQCPNEVSRSARNDIDLLASQIYLRLNQLFERFKPRFESQVLRHALHIQIFGQDVGDQF